MGHIVFDDEIDRITFEDGEWVDIRSRMSYGDRQRLLTHYMKVDAKLKQVAQPDVDIDIDIESGNLELMVINIKAWSFKDQENKVLPINKKTISMLDDPTSGKIVQEIGQRNPVPKVSTSTKKST